MSPCEKCQTPVPDEDMYCPRHLVEAASRDVDVAMGDLTTALGQVRELTGPSRVEELDYSEMDGLLIALVDATDVLVKRMQECRAAHELWRAGTGVSA